MGTGDPDRSRSRRSSERLNEALPLHFRSAVAYTVAAGAVTGLVVEKLQDVIRATGQAGPSEALEHRLEPRGLRPLTAYGRSPGYGKQEQIDALERARRG